MRCLLHPSAPGSRRRAHDGALGGGRPADRRPVRVGISAVPALTVPISTLCTSYSNRRAACSWNACAVGAGGCIRLRESAAIQFDPYDDAGAGDVLPW